MHQLRNLVWSGIALTVACFGQPSFTITPISVPAPDASGNAGTVTSFLKGFDKNGRFIGSFSIPNPNFPGQAISQCFILDGAKVNTLATPGLSCSPSAPNANGDFTGTLTAPGGTPSAGAFSFANGAFNPIAWPAELNVNTSTGSAISGNGNIAGWVTTGQNLDQRGFVYSGGQVTLLPNLGGGGPDYVRAVNNSGDAVGQSTATDSPDLPPGPLGQAAKSPRAVLWSHTGEVIDLGRMLDPNVQSGAAAINDQGQVAGFLMDGPGQLGVHAVPFFYDGIQMQRIQVPDATHGAVAQAMNNHGEVVGTFNSFHPMNAMVGFIVSAFYYANGTAVDLNSLVVNAPAGVHLEAAYSISDSGQILAAAPVNGSYQAFLLTPTSASAQTQNDPVAAVK